MTTHPAEHVTSEITRRLISRLDKHMGIDQLYEEIIAELKEEYATNPEEQLHYASRSNPTSSALCGESAPEGGWFNERALAKAQTLKLFGGICPICASIYSSLPAD
ncbi:MAG: hypothetical protein Q4A03_02610 [Rothia sp. (in: high G+C Gram-positive bacteria)]|uniref:hypothetical protein n=1 Tax=Rothia sp. (in: high G+C Gram-positive bacteria) TaxID=1885016 RepID=UPI00270537E0|nr:hypothetical protein [Rothia sp. (in: high G+C Gram-positive bacteria)]